MKRNLLINEPWCLKVIDNFGIEIKAGDNQPTALQQRELAMIKRRGGVALVINETTLDELHDTLCGMSSCT